jgi:ABC-type transport system involved in multi-copper enzyme maturation permease subunit
MMPILRKELRALMRERRGFFIPVIYALTQASFTALAFIGQRATEVDPVVLGRALATTVVALQSGAVLYFSPLMGASMIAGERERGTWARLISSCAPRDGIVAGKLASACLYLLLLLSISFPMAALSLLFGGLDFATLAGLYLTHALIAVCLASLGLAVSTAFRRTWAASFLALGLTLSLTVGLPIAGVAFAALTRSPLPGSVYAVASDERAQLFMRVTWWFNPMYGLRLLFGGIATRLDWIAHYLAMFALGAGFFVVALVRVRRSGA